MLLSQLSQELCRLVFDRKRLSEVENEAGISPAPVQLFISYARSDGEKLAKELKQYIDGETLIHSFFDAKDIARGVKFQRELEANLKQSILLVIQTDAYSTREWCRKEVIAAKRFNSPVMIISALTKGEDRSFPYMANVPTINWNLEGSNKKTLMEEAILKAMLEALRYRFHKENIRYLIDTFNVKLEDRNILETPPELLSFIKIKSSAEKIIVYPDPPLGDEEIQVLNEFEPGVRFVTPTVIPTLEASSPRFLANARLGISISESQDISIHGLGRMHLQDAMVEFARYLLVCGAVLAYGGDVRYNTDFNFATKLFELVETHNIERKEPGERIKNFISFPIFTKIVSSERSKLIKSAELIEVPPPDDLEIKETIDKIFKNKSPRTNYIWARCLSHMREEMNRNIHARIILGGKTGNFKGKYPGLLEEAYLAMKMKKPVYLIGAFGGCARAIIKAIQGETPAELTQNHQFSNPSYKDFAGFYNEEVKNHDALEPVDYEGLLDFLHKKGINGLNNGLSEAENLRLFATRSIPEMISLVLKGLNKIKPGY